MNLSRREMIPALGVSAGFKTGLTGASSAMVDGESEYKLARGLNYLNTAARGRVAKAKLK